MIKAFVVVTQCCLLLFLSSCDQALERSLTEDKVQLLAPVHSSTTTDSIHTFYWEPVEGATKYQLQIVTPRFDFIGRLQRDVIIDRNQFKDTLKDASYQWRVRALNTSTTSQYSDTFHLTIQ